jgi:parallel beta-helix repeat protein
VKIKTILISSAIIGILLTMVFVYPMTVQGVQPEPSNTTNADSVEPKISANTSATSLETPNSDSWTVPKDDLYINSDTTFRPGIYNIPDTGEEGVIIINASNIVLDGNGATIIGNLSGSDYGIYCRNHQNVTIKNLTMMRYVSGIEIEMSRNITIAYNDLILNRYGIYLFQSQNNTVTENNASFNQYKGIVLAGSSNNTIINNSASDNEDGILVGSVAKNNRIEHNNASFNQQAGIYVYGISNSNSFINNVLKGNQYGLYLGTCICPTCGHYCPGGNIDNTISANEIVNNGIGIYSNQSISIMESNIICNNTITDSASSE